MTPLKEQHPRAGAMYAFLAYGTWGFFPLYWHMLALVPATEILAHRILWSCAFFGVLMPALGQSGAVFLALQNSRARALYAASASLIGINWGIYIYAVNSGHVLESSLGYFINPLVNVVLGIVFLRERLRPLQGFAVALAALGVAQLALGAQAFPWIAVSLALSFGFYGLLRKLAPCPSLVGSTLESMILFPLAAAYLVYLEWNGTGVSFHAHPRELMLLALGGAVTALPLLWFSEAAKRLPMATLGFFQYISPTLQFLLAVTFFHEPFTSVHMRSFGCIWLALLVFSVESWRSRKYPKSL